ncbi:hypothetical protein Scep_005172 [Stephania cephalantha]|uniref:Pentatricopeptide repeat-containing protein n=1 Tax=Stephania cephalantha TaxID=152367 RepID=A0AAP0KV80_9MAGN
MPLNARFLLLLLRENASPDLMLDFCKTVKQGLQVHAQIVLRGLHDRATSLSKLVSFFALFGSQFSLDYACLIFSQIDRPSVFIWNTMIRGYSRSESPNESLVLFKSMMMSAAVSPNNFTYPFLINACAKMPRIDSGRGVHAQIAKTGFESNLFIRNALVHLYCSFGGLDNAQLVFDESWERDCVSFNTMIHGHAQFGRAMLALGLFREMQGSGIEPDEFTMVAVLSACSALNDLNTGKLVHLLLCKDFSFYCSNSLLMSALIDMYAKCGSMSVAERLFGRMGTSKTMAAWSSLISGYSRCGEIETARHFFDGMLEKDLVSWTAMISGYSQMGKCKEALDLFVEMESAGVKPDEVTLAAALSACARLGALGFGERLHHQYVKTGFLVENSILATAIVDMYVKGGRIETALEIFHKVKPKLKYVFLYNSIICGLAQHGHSETALEVFGEMKSSGLSPDAITFIGALCACSHGGLIEEGTRIFNSMFKDHGLKPKTEHYCCMVDLLGRNGHLKAAYEFILKMPFEADAVVWRSLLSACRTHGNVDIGEVAAKKLLELDPDHGAHFVLLSNILTDANRWEDAQRMRELMDDKSIVKPPGWSYIELNGIIHQFQASDKSHPQAKEIELILQDMAKRLKSRDHFPE